MPDRAGYKIGEEKMDNTMDMEWKIEGDNLYVAISGKLDTLRAMNLDDKMNELPDTVCNITFDFDGLIYIASAGLRILYWSQEYTEEKGGHMKVKNVTDEVLEVFNMTGFTELIEIE